MSDLKQSPSHRIGLYGGAFDPPHIAHVLVAAWALATGELDEIWVIPTGGHPFGKQLTPWEHRIQMCFRAFECFGERVSLLDIEQEPRIHYSIDTVRTLQLQVPGKHWRWIMGSDTLADAPKWKDWESLTQLAPPLIIPRTGHPITPGDPDPFALPPISSTHIREALTQKNYTAIAPILPAVVLEYIREQNLYIQN